jgi:CheY-like chemotaxis protein|tara:strand:- start:21964 stop:22617 length:654 start_codon:yes stop_codon:yes gene_type:complete
MTTSNKPVALIVHGSGITAKRLRTILKTRGWDSTICNDGDKAVDEYVKLKPTMTFIGLNLPTLDGHVAALEMRESDPSARIVFVVSRSRSQKARDAAFSAGAVAVLTTPLTQSDFDQNWVIMNGPIPEAPGLADLDELYPELQDDLTEDLPPLPGFPPIDGPTPQLDTPPIDGPPPLPEPIAETTQAKPRSRALRILAPLVALVMVGVAVFLFQATN